MPDGVDENKKERHRNKSTEGERPAEINLPALWNRRRGSLRGRLKNRIGHRERSTGESWRCRLPRRGLQRFARSRFFDRSNETVPVPGNGFNEPRILGGISERFSKAHDGGV